MDLPPSNIIDNIPHTEIRPSAVHGFGLFATKPINAKTILGILDGQVMNWDEYDRLSGLLELPQQAKCNIFMEWNALSVDKLLVRPLRTKYSFINHSRMPNVQLEHFPLRIVATRNLDAGEELLLDYRLEPLREEYLNGHGKTYL